jgi:thioredoxin 1
MAGSDWPSELMELNKGNFESVMAKYENVVVDCWAPWCGPCLALEPALKELAKEFMGRVLFAKMNTDENLEIARGLGIMSLPTILYFKNGVYENRITGSVQMRIIKEKVEELMVPR